jgi:hypothetical protein
MLKNKPQFAWRDVIDTTMRHTGATYKVGTLDEVAAGVEMMIDDARKSKKVLSNEKIIDLIEQMLVVREIKSAA